MVLLKGSYDLLYVPILKLNYVLCYHVTQKIKKAPLQEKQKQNKNNTTKKQNHQ